MPIRQTRTYATLEVSKVAYDEIAAKLRCAGYDHVFMDSGAIDMHGLALINYVAPDGGIRPIDPNHAPVLPK